MLFTKAQPLPPWISQIYGFQAVFKPQVDGAESKYCVRFWEASPVEKINVSHNLSVLIIHNLLRSILWFSFQS